MDIPEEFRRRDYQMFRGIPLASLFVENWKRVEQFQVRPDDLLIASFPKSGTTWMCEIMDLILNNGDVKKCQRDAVYNRVVMLEFAGVTTIQPGTEVLSRMPSPRLLRTHLPISLLPKSFWENSCKVIYVARNAKDVAVSSYHFAGANILHPHPGTWEHYLEKFMAGKVMFGSWHEHVTSWWEKRNDLRLLYLFYEDMKEEFVEIGRITLPCTKMRNLMRIMKRKCQGPPCLFVQKSKE
ncbi:sulfotransferase 1B1-like isoform X2 [Ambystoma mexicanum]|uniref:sulfotransferase 1B1-like isoform X2 n=1 Tax=Ambystoma mexicanum TaxID=8296 RepID=UPI0037E852FB